jgi:dihydrolipoamide dehydrogenase
LSIDVAQMMKRKDKIVADNRAGILYLFKKNKVANFHGKGSLASGDGSGWTLKVALAAGGEETLHAKQVILATGSSPRQLPGAPVDNQRILDNAGALSLTAVPKSLGVIGAGVIGLEMGSVWRRLGAEVTVLEALPAFLGLADDAIAKEALRVLTKDEGLAIELGVKIDKISAKKLVNVEYTDAAGAKQSKTFEKLIVAIGRAPNTAGLNAAGVGLALNERGQIEVDEQCRSNLPGVWAIGDVVRGPMLAHKAEEEGMAVAERIAGQHAHVEFNTIPWVIYTQPEIAWVGQTEQQLRAAGVTYRSGQFPFLANGRAKGLGETRGFVKFLADAKTDRVLGVHIIGPFASELISEAVVAMEFGASSEDIARICHAHPSLAEVVKEAALAVDKRAIHI